MGAIELNRWYHIAFTYDYNSTNNDPVIYIDGQAVDVTEEATPGGTLIGSDTATIHIGNMAGGTVVTNVYDSASRVALLATSRTWLIHRQHVRRRDNR